MAQTKKKKKKKTSVLSATMKKVTIKQFSEEKHFI
jgi:hypothetical protein